MYTQIISAISDMLSEIFKFKTKQIEKQSETVMICDKKNCEKASNIAEKIIKISTKYKNDMTISDRLRLIRLIEKFEKYD